MLTQNQIEKDKPKIIFKDYRTIHSFSNLYVEGDYNPLNIKYVDDEMINYFFQHKKCYTCSLELERIPPKCLLNCRFKTHQTCGRNKKTFEIIRRANIELERKTNKYKLYISRHHLVMNHMLYQLGYKMIIWPGIDSKIQVHHKNGNFYDDRKENLCLVFVGSDDNYSHNNIAKNIRKYRNHILNLNFQLQKIKANDQNIINNLIKENKTSSDLENEIKELLSKIHELNDIIISPPIKEYLDEAQEHINRGELFEPDWIKKKLERYSEKYIFVKNQGE